MVWPPLSGSVCGKRRYERGDVGRREHEVELTSCRRSRLSIGVISGNAQALLREFDRPKFGLATVRELRSGELRTDLGKTVTNAEIPRFPSKARNLTFRGACLKASIDYGRTLAVRAKRTTPVMPSRTQLLPLAADAARRPVAQSFGYWRLEAFKLRILNSPKHVG